MLSIKQGWLNDPNGMVKFKGKYHLYFQSLPNSSVWRFGIGWGHATSVDKKHWDIDLGRCLEPSTTYDMDGCFSGSAIVHNNKVYAFYTGVTILSGQGSVDENQINFKETQCLAVSEDGYEFLKLPEPILKDPPVKEVYGWRDPFIFEYEGMFYLLLGSGWCGKGRVLLYKGTSGFPCESWEYVGVIASIDKDIVLECPYMGHLKDDVWILGASCDKGEPVYWTGSFDGGKFVPSNDLHVLKDTLGYDIYAPTIVNADGKSYFWAWVRNTKMLRGPCEILYDENLTRVMPLS
jgi:beta-fructofuranosidase